MVDFQGFLKLVTSDRMDLSKNAKAMLSKAKVKKYQKAFKDFDEDHRSIHACLFVVVCWCVVECLGGSVPGLVCSYHS